MPEKLNRPALRKLLQLAINVVEKLKTGELVPLHRPGEPVEKPVPEPGHTSAEEEALPEKPGLTPILFT